MTHTDYKVIENEDGELFGFPGDVLQYLRESMAEELKHGNYVVIDPVWLDVFGELERLNDCENFKGAVRVSECNGMGWGVSIMAPTKD